jgi:hypothetical protein
MFRLDKVIKPWKEAASLNDHINLYGFWSETAFLTKSGDVGMVLSVPGVDYESLDHAEQEYAVKRLEAALKAFGSGFHVYQYLFKSNRPDIPFARYDDPVVEAAIDQRRQFFEGKRDRLYQVEIFYAIVLEGPRSKSGVGAAFAQLFRDPAGAIGELRTQFTNNSMKMLLRSQIEGELARLNQKVQAFARQLSDFMQIEVLDQQGQFRFFRRLLNYEEWRIAGKPQSTQFLDYQVVNSNIEAERDHLRVGDHVVRVLTMKEAITETRPLVLDALLKIPANFYVVTEWTPLATDKARKEVNKRRRHFNMSKTGFVSQMGNDATKTNPRDVLVDESKQADIENLGDCLRALGDGQSLGDFSLTIVVYAPTKAETDQIIGEFTSVFTNADGNLFTETYNQLNAYFATIPGNYAQNLRKLYLLNSNYADLSFLFTILPGEKRNAHLGTEYLAVLETDNSTPYFLNLHNGEVAHTLILGMTGSGKTRLIMQLLRQIQSRGHSAIVYDPACEFVQRFYDRNRQDIILNPLDARCPYWGPSEELRRRAEAKAIAASLYQPTTDRKGEFFVETPQKIFAHLLTFGPTPQELVEWMANPDEIDRRVQGTEMASMIAKNAPQQRNGVLASLGLIADSLRMLPMKGRVERNWSATEWAEDRQGWIFLTSKPSEREALRPLHSLWIDLLVLRLLNEPKENQHPVWFVLDELASLQRLPQLHTAITENRKSKNPLVLGFQGKAQLEVIYGHMAEVMLSQPATKIFLKTTEPKAAEWVSNAIGKVEIERMRETHFDGTRAGKNFSLDRQVEPLVLDSEISGLPDKHAFLKLGNHVARFSFAYSDIPATQDGFVPRPLEDDDLSFDPKTLAKKPPKSVDMPAPEAEDDENDEPVRTGFSLGD